MTVENPYLFAGSKFCPQCGAKMDIRSVLRLRSINAGNTAKSVSIKSGKRGTALLYTICCRMEK